MDYLIVNTSLMVKGKNYPEGGKISDSVLTKQDLKDLDKYLKPVTNKEKQPQPANASNTTTRNSNNKNSK
ncbi:MAG: hypothetical protein WBV81_02745 [Ignavibacteriaceae bacterium]